MNQVSENYSEWRNKNGNIWSIWLFEDSLDLLMTSHFLFLFISGQNHSGERQYILLPDIFVLPLVASSTILCQINIFVIKHAILSQSCESALTSLAEIVVRWPSSSPPSSRYDACRRFCRPADCLSQHPTAIYSPSDPTGCFQQRSDDSHPCSRTFKLRKQSFFKMYVTFYSFWMWFEQVHQHLDLHNVSFGVGPSRTTWEGHRFMLWALTVDLVFQVPTPWALWSLVFRSTSQMLPVTNTP